MSEYSAKTMAKLCFQQARLAEQGSKDVLTPANPAPISRLLENLSSEFDYAAERFADLVEMESLLDRWVDHSEYELHEDDLQELVTETLTLLRAKK